MAKTEQKQSKASDTTAHTVTKMKRKRKTEPRGSPPQRSSIYRGVTRHRWTGRYEAHLWDKNCWNETQSKKGRQVYLGAYNDEEAAAHAYDMAALKYWGQDTTLNFPVATYENEVKEMECQSKEEYIGYLRRKSNGFSRGVSKYRGVARHHHNGKWEARIGRVLGNKYLYLGTFATQEEAAIAYDIAAVQYRGLNAVTNFDISRYDNSIKPNEDSTKTPNDPQLTPSLDGEINPITSPNEEVVVGFIDKQQQTSSSTTETQQYLLDSPTGATSVSYLELISRSPKCEEMLEKMPVYNCLPVTTQDYDCRTSIFPKEIQTYFDCEDSNSYIKGDDDIFGDLNSFVPSMFEFELDV